MSLTYGTLRYHLHRQLLLAARVGAQIGIVSDQVVALATGQPVTFGKEQLGSFFPGGQTQHPSLPVDYDVAESWLLTGDDALTPA
jgi:hypothetical protein